MGKTSAARIFAKALQCVHGPSPAPCNRCDICRCIASGDDIDVIEINGARQRGLDDYVSSRFSVTTRPFRARFKIYIIDQVDFLTGQAINSLLDILEEPPAHVKFVFCTSNPDRLPRTMLSRLQRFDFFPVEISEIVERLLHIVDTEGVRAEPEALKILAQLANGSVRESLSFLETLVSLGGGDVITAQAVHQMLGMARSGRLRALFDRLVSRDSAGALAELEVAVYEGVDVGILVRQLLGFYRDLAAALVGCPAELMHFLPTRDYVQFQVAAKELGLATILAAMQILDRTETIIRQRAEGRIHAELALMQICGLENLDDLSSIVAWLRGNDSDIP